VKTIYDTAGGTMNTDELPAIFSIACPIKDKYKAIDEWLEVIILRKVREKKRTPKTRGD